MAGLLAAILPRRYMRSVGGFFLHQNLTQPTLNCGPTVYRMCIGGQQIKASHRPLQQPAKRGGVLVRWLVIAVNIRKERNRLPLLVGENVLCRRIVQIRTIALCDSLALACGDYAP